MTRIGLTQLQPLGGSAAWWLSAACMLPGLCVYGALRLLLRRTHTRTLTDCARKLLGNFGGILIMLALTLPLLLDGIASLTALITFFTEGIGARGSQFTLTLLTASVMLIALNRDGLPRGVYLLRHVLLVAATTIAINALLDAHPLAVTDRATVVRAFVVRDPLLPAALVLLTLTIVQRIIPATTIRQVEIQYDHRVETTGYIKAFFATHSVDVLNVDFHSENSKNERVYTSIYTVRMSARVNLVDLFGPLSEYEHVRAFRIRQPQ